MTNLLALSFYMPFCAISAILLITVIRQFKGYHSYKQILVYFSTLLCWQIAEISYFFVTDGDLMKTVFYIKMILLPFVPAGLFMIIMSYYRAARFMPKWVYAAVFVIPGISIIMAAIPVTRPFVADVWESYHSDGINTLSVHHGSWYIVMQVYCLLVYLALFIVIFTFFRRLPKAYRGGSLFHLIGIGIVMSCALLEYIILPNQNVSFINVGTACCGVAVYLAIQSLGRTNNMQIDKGEIFNYLDEAVFILNENSQIVEGNRPAHLWLKSLGRLLEGITFKGLMAVLTNNKWISCRQIEGQAGLDIYFIRSSYPLIYRMDRHSFKDAEDGPLGGELITITDVTRNRLLIERLRDMAGVDALTGLANRYRYQDLLRQLDKRENYPLTIIIGDANGLKMVNDTFGHKMGDDLLRSIAGALKACCPPNGYIARYGGDEFVALLPSCTQEQGVDFMDEVYLKLQDTDTLPVKPSIALGSATKHHGNENLSALIAQADKKMYDDKIMRKKIQQNAQ